MRQPRAIDAEHLVQVTIEGEFDALRIPGLPRPEPHPSGAADECADDNHHYPQADKTKQERPNRKFTLLVGVIAVPQWVGVYIGYDHQSGDDQRRHDYPCDPRIE